MAWDFSTEPEFRAQLDWVGELGREEVEPLDLVFPGAACSRVPAQRDAARPTYARLLAAGPDLAARPAARA